MILLDTHIWIWWIEKSARLTSRHEQHIQANAGDLAVSVMSCWEIARLVSAVRLYLTLPLSDWFQLAGLNSGVKFLDLTPDIAIEANHLPGTFHRDPVDQIIVATARILDIPLLTADAKILNYPHVHLLV